MKKVAVIMAGGGGTRLWPLSTPATPKHMLPLTSPHSMLRETLNRIYPLVGEQGILMVTTKDLADEVVREGKVPKEKVLVEPCRRNTAPAVALSTMYVMDHMGGDTIMMVLPADHHIEPPQALAECLDKACRLAAQGWMVTMGIEPTRPETGYGYLETGEALKPHGYRVVRFTEKPSLERAREFLKKGNFYWNSGIFVWQASTLWRELKKHLPQVALPLERLMGRPWEEIAPLLQDLYPAFPHISIDYAVMEKAHRVAMVPATFQWCDVGSWEALWNLLEKDRQGNVLRGDSQVLETENSLVWGQGITVKVLGLENTVVVATPQGVLVCSMEKSQEIKKLLAKGERA